MRITVDIDCTPQEMRAFFGLPDLEPMQQAVMEELQRRMVSSLDQLSPATMMKDWFGPMNSALSQVFLGAFTGGAPRRRPADAPAGGSDDSSAQSPAGPGASSAGPGASSAGPGVSSAGPDRTGDVDEA